MAAPHEGQKLAPALTPGRGERQHRLWDRISFFKLLQIEGMHSTFTAAFGLVLLLFLLASSSVVSAQTSIQAENGAQVKGFRGDPNTAIDTIVFLGAEGYPPYGFIEKGLPAGANIDFLNALGEKLGLHVDVRLYKWADAQARFNNGEGDALAIGAITEERKKLYDFTQSTFIFEFMLFAQSHRIEEFEQLDFLHKRIAITEGSYPEAILRNGYPEAEIVFVDEMAEGFQLLTEGKVDAAIEERLVGNFLLKREGFQGITWLEDSLATNSAHIPLRKGNTALLDELNQGISALKSTG
jgi:polar amino acid transport system substrate-binding protein